MPTEGYIYCEPPLGAVVLRNGYSIRNFQGDEVVHFEDVLGLSKAIRAAIIFKRGRLSADEVAYLRRKLDMSQVELARLLGVEAQTLSLWERASQNIPKAADCLLRLIFVELQAGQLPIGKRKLKPSDAAGLAGALLPARYLCSWDDTCWTIEQVCEERTVTLHSQATQVNDESFMTDPRHLGYKLLYRGQSSSEDFTTRGSDRFDTKHFVAIESVQINYEAA